MSTKLPEGLTCGDCFHIRRCQFLIQQSPTEKRCDFDPSPMQVKAEEVEKPLNCENWCIIGIQNAAKCKKQGRCTFLQAKGISEVSLCKTPLFFVIHFKNCSHIQ